jgi:hypothetical protein
MLKYRRIEIEIAQLSNGTTHFEKSKQLLEYQNLHLLSDLW